MKSLWLNLLAIAMNTVSLALAWWLLGDTDLDLPSVGGVGDYVAAGLALWIVGTIFDTDRRMEKVLDS